MMKPLNIKEVKVTNVFHKGTATSDYIITYEDLSYQIFDVEDITEYDMHRIAEFMKTSQIDVTIRRYRKSNTTKTIGRYYI